MQVHVKPAQLECYCVVFLLLLGGVADAQPQSEPTHPLIGNSNMALPVCSYTDRVAEKMLELAEVKVLTSSMTWVRETAELSSWQRRGLGRGRWRRAG